LNRLRTRKLRFWQFLDETESKNVTVANRKEIAQHAEGASSMEDFMSFAKGNLLDQGQRLLDWDMDADVGEVGPERGGSLCLVPRDLATQLGMKTGKLALAAEPCDSKDVKFEREIDALSSFGGDDDSKQIQRKAMNISKRCAELKNELREKLWEAEDKKSKGLVKYQMDALDGALACCSKQTPQTSA
jgi:hypothetical protein